MFQKSDHPRYRPSWRLAGTKDIRSNDRQEAQLGNIVNIPHQRLTYFQVTAEAGSIRRAAVQLNISPSAISRQLSLIESEVNSPLFERTQSGVQLTPVGEMLLDHCRRRNQLDHEFNDALDAYQQMETGQITLHIGEGFVGDVIDKPLRDFGERYHGVRLKINTGSTREIIDAVISDSAHVGLIYHEQNHPLLRFRYSSLQPLVALLPPSHPLTFQTGPISMDALTREPMAVWHAGHGVRRLIDDGFREARLRPKIGIETNSLTVLKHAVMSGVNITLLPAFSAAQELKHGLLIARPVNCPRFLQAQAHIITRIGRRIPRAGIQILRHLEGWLCTGMPKSSH